MRAIPAEPITPAELRDIIATCRPHLRGIFSAMRDTGCGFLLVRQWAGAFEAPPVPLFIGIIGDDETSAFGPAAFDEASVGRVLSMVHAIVIVPGRPSAAVYDLCAAHARAGRAAVIIETRLGYRQTWRELVTRLAPGKPLLIADAWTGGCA